MGSALRAVSTAFFTSSAVAVWHSVKVFPEKKKLQTKKATIKLSKEMEKQTNSNIPLLCHIQNKTATFNYFVVCIVRKLSGDGEAHVRFAATIVIVECDR